MSLHSYKRVLFFNIIRDYRFNVGRKEEKNWHRIKRVNLYIYIIYKWCVWYLQVKSTNVCTNISASDILLCDRVFTTILNLFIYYFVLLFNVY